MDDGREGVPEGDKINMVSYHGPRLDRLRNRDNMNKTRTVPFLPVGWFRSGPGRSRDDDTKATCRGGGGRPVLAEKKSQ